MSMAKHSYIPSQPYNSYSPPPPPPSSLPCVATKLGMSPKPAPPRAPAPAAPRASNRRRKSAVRAQCGRSPSARTHATRHGCLGLNVRCRVGATHQGVAPARHAWAGTARQGRAPAQRACVGDAGVGVRVGVGVGSERSFRLSRATAVSILRPRCIWRLRKFSPLCRPACSASVMVLDRSGW